MRKIGELGSAVYAHKSLLRSGRDRRNDVPWIGFARVADRWPEFHWIADNIPAAQVVMTVNGGPSYTELVSCGYGAGILTCVEAKSRAALKRLSGPEPLIVRDIWLLVLPELRRNPAIRRVLDWIIAVAEEGAQSLRGTTANGPSSDSGQ